MARIKDIKEFTELRKKMMEETFREGIPRVRVCCGTACVATGARKVIEGIKEAAKERGEEVDIVQTGCQGLCQKGPVMKAEPAGYFYQKVKAADAQELVGNTYTAGVPARKLLYRESFMNEPHEMMDELPFYKKQTRIALRNNGVVDPTKIEHYLAVGGYAALEKALSSMTPDSVLGEVDKANLRGRGGAGFPAGKKWLHTKKAPGDIKFVIANGDEGDPGAFMDRSIMEGDPHSLIEGMLLCAYAINAQYGFVYVRHEYPLAVKNLKIAIKQAEDLGILGENILGTGFSFVMDVREGAGAFVCGESTALVASIEGDRGFPRPRPPRLSEPGGGIWGYPSNLNNIESYACVPPIIEKGFEWFRSIGTETSPGTKVFALTGKVVNTGLVEVPMGMSLREIIYDIGGGIMEGKKFKAVQTGGPSGGCLPESYLDMPVDFDSLWKVGSMMGSGGMVVMDEDTCMVDVARYFLSFTQAESCGKCPPCRIGTYQMLQILERICNGHGQSDDIAKLIELGKSIQAGSLCGLGQSAPNPVLSTIKYFRDEYEEHIYDNHCRANVCNGMGVFKINLVKCIRCGLCKDACAFDAVKETKHDYVIDNDYCTQCKACYHVCPVDAIKIWKQSLVSLQEKFDIPYEQLEHIERSTKMTLKDVLESKPSQIVTCTQDCKISDAVSIMDGKGVGSILIMDKNEKLIGIFTERDVMHCFSQKVSFNDDAVGKVMSKNIVALDSSTDIGVAVNVMSKHKIRHLPVLENEKLKGMISYRDLVSYLLPEVIFMAEDIY
jgi:NADH:ubiquinone oxidoreductase subunit F (NADH-binding)/CBS domain-containing protein/(2Fe-2S) ferredoxin/NAD-dependent dihydropyrimidine dehydrogenase PreA subunit